MATLRSLLARVTAIHQQIQLVHDLLRRLLACGQRGGAAVVARHLACRFGEFIRCSACTTVVSLVRSHGGSWFGSGRPKLSRNTDCVPHRPHLHRPRPRRHGGEHLRHAGDVADRVEQHLGAQPLAVVPRVVAHVADVAASFGSDDRP